MRQGYHSGATGILASALAWSVAAGFAALASPQQAVWALLVGGMFIHPVGLLACKLLGSRGAHAKGNPFGLLAGASTFWLIFCLPIAYLLSLHWPGLFFPAMLLVIGGRYLVFATIYGMRFYWILGLVLAAAGFALAALGAPLLAGALAGALLEALFGIACLVLHRRGAGPEAETRLHGA
ncbi:hypothetical protein N787_05925 [Arenimonas metalli CF5-1]|uniref:Uncharacterized protein n=2 Tax=Arenimonas TaxID=490567 RepID=A0A091AMU8_9GAMM|nr:hypothetical protein N787_05925 [Arenimonas metalli CF5-1]